MDSSMLGSYGTWIEDLESARRRDFSFLDDHWNDVAAWSVEARRLFSAFVLSQDLGTPRAEITARRTIGDLDGGSDLTVEELAWRLPYGPPTRAIFLKPAHATERLPAVLALHDHGANKYFGKRKIADADETVHPHVRQYRELYYGGRAWANELARRGYAVLVPDVFPFESRKILASELPGFVVERMMQDPDELRELTPESAAIGGKCTTYDVFGEEPSDSIDRYNAFASQHESIVAKSLFCAGLSWPGVALSEDRAALDYLASRPDVDPERIGCGGFSGGGLRTNYLAGSDPRVRCSVTTGFMTTWADFALNSSHTHTWMLYIPGLSARMDLPDILAMRSPLPTLVQATTEDPLFTRGLVEKAGEILEASWRKAGSADRFRMAWHKGPHRFDLAMQEEAFDWFDRWL
ncbi:MAG: dienelactone hydrolase family protein [Treponema sp.]|nr:dienelactone hydrolase family protein [Treponema sp.]